LLLLDGQVHHDTHAVPMGNYVIGVGNYVIATPSELGNYMSADNRCPRVPRLWEPGSQIAAEKRVTSDRVKPPGIAGLAVCRE
jgi:hypothetical protein